MKASFGKSTSDYWFRTSALAFAIVLIGLALQRSDGFMSRGAVVSLTLCLGVCLAASRAQPPEWFARNGARVVPKLLSAALLLQLTLMLFREPAYFLRFPTRGDPIFLAGMALAFLAAGLSLTRVRPALWLALLIAVYLGLGTWILMRTPAPLIDVWYAHQSAYADLLHGKTPYNSTWPDIYGPKRDNNIPGTVVNGRVISGYPYPPLTLLAGLPGDLLADFRYMLLLSVALSAWLIAMARPSREAALATALFLFTPRCFFQIVESWTEPYVVLFFAATVFCAVRGLGRWVPLFLGLTVAAKQHLFLILALASRLLPERWRWKDYAALIAKSGAVAALTVIPFFLWEPRAFIRAITATAVKHAIRLDALSYGAILKRYTPLHFPIWAGLAAGAIVTAIVRRRSPGPSGFALASACFYLAFFLFSDYAFCNYYFMIMGMLAAGIATGVVEPSDMRRDANEKTMIPVLG